MSKIFEPPTWTPSKYTNALRFFFDPERLQLGGWRNGFSELIIDYSKGGIQLGPELLKNGDVEAGLGTNGSADGWWGGYNGTYSLETGTVHSGTNAVRFTLDNATYNNGNVYYEVPNVATNLGVAVGDIIKAEFWFHKGNLSTGGAASKPIQITVYQHDGVSAWSYNNMLTYNLADLPDNEWIKLHYFTRVKYTNNWRIQLGINGSDGAGDSTYFFVDDFSIKKVTNGYHGIAEGDLRNTGWGTHQQAVNMDGVNDEINFGDVINLGNNSAIIWGWGKFEGQQTGLMFSKLDDWAGPRWGMWMRDDATGPKVLWVYLADSAAGFYSHSGTNSLTLGSWHLCVLVIDREAGMARIFINNVLKSEWDISTMGTLDNTDRLRIGALETNHSTGLNGNIGVYIFDGLNGAPNTLPSDYQVILDDIWNGSRAKYGL